MKIFIIVVAVNSGSMAPEVETSYHTDRALAEEEFNEYLENVGDDHETIFFDEFDTDTGVTTSIDSFEGNEEDRDSDDEEDE